MSLLLLLLVAGAVWGFWMPGVRFSQGLAGLLSDPVVHAWEPWRFLTGRQHVHGRYHRHPVVLEMHLKRLKYRPGHLTLAMQTSHPPPPGQAVAGAGAIRGLLADQPARDALDELELSHGMTLAFERGWLTGTWTPIGFFVFPGRFDPARWTAVLRDLRTVTEALEQQAPTSPVAG